MSKKSIVFQVIVSDCEATYTVCICRTKKIAERELFKVRDKFLKEWRRMNKFLNDRISNKNISYIRMIKNLSSDNYEEWNNHPHETISITRSKIIED